MRKRRKFVFQKERISPHFIPLLLSNDRTVIAYGARGGGKTQHIIYKLLAHTYSASYENIYYCRHEWETLRKTTFLDIKNFLENFPAMRQDFHYSTSANSSMVFTNKLTGWTLSPFGLDDPDKAKGLPNPTRIWVDEADKCNKDQVDAVDATLRTPAADYLQLILSLNPVDIQHWIRGTYFTKDDAYKAIPGVYAHHSTARDNIFIDAEAYIQHLLKIYAGDQAKIDTNVYGLWGVAKNDNPWAYNFNYDKHVKPKLPYIRTYPIYLSFDFNRTPLTCTAYQISPLMGRPDSFIHAIKEFVGDMQLSELCARIKETYPGAVFFVTGDSSGNKGDVAMEDRNQTYFTSIMRLLNISRKQLKLIRSNLRHSDSRHLVNLVLHHYPNLYISEEGCPGLIRDLQIAVEDEKSKTPGQLKKDRQNYKMDLMDSFRYFLQKFFLKFVNQTYLKNDPKTTIGGQSEV